jgi:hypothetical protein
LQKDKSKKGSSKKESFNNKFKKSLVATLDECDKESESEKDDEEANLALMATTTSDVESEAHSDDEVFSELAREELVNVIRYPIGHCIGKSKSLKVLQRQYDLVTEESKKLSIQNENLLVRNIFLETG